MTALRVLPCVCYLCASFNGMCLVGLEHKVVWEKKVNIHGGNQHVNILYELIRE